jgi:hypothetical protein
MTTPELACLCVLLEKFLTEINSTEEEHQELFHAIYTKGKETIEKKNTLNAFEASTQFYDLCKKASIKLSEALTTRLIGG